MSVVAAVVVGTLAGGPPQSVSPAAIYVEADSTTTRDYAIEVDGGTLPIVSINSGPHPLSAIVLHDVSTSVQPVDLDGVARAIASTARAGDRIRLASFADRVLIGSIPIVDRPSATAAAREVSQSVGASPLWDAICQSAEALRNSGGLPAIVVFSDGQRNANDRGAVDALDATTGARVIVSVVGVSDTALRVRSAMEVHGRNDALRQLADDTGGGFVELREPRDRSDALIANALKDLRGRVRVEFDPPVHDGALHRVSVTVRGRLVYGPARVRL